MTVSSVEETPGASRPVHDIHVDYGVATPMRDGTLLRADVYRPRTAGLYPVLVERMGYELISRCSAPGEYFAHHGYVFVGQNVRGTYASEGEYRPWRDDGWGLNRDGYDTVEWAAAQAWSNGEVGMLGGSYSGYTQYLTAPTRPPHLKAMFARGGLTDLYRDMVFTGGAHQLLCRDFALKLMLLPQLQHPSAPPGSAAVRSRVEQALEDLHSWNHHLPMGSFPPCEGVADWYLEWLAHPEDGPYWWQTNATLKQAEIDVPIVHFGGWFDVFRDSLIRYFQGIHQRGRSERCRAGQRLIVGPWIHGPTAAGARQVGELDFGPEAPVDLDALRLRWFDYWLKGVANGVGDEPPVRVFLMGPNRWMDLPSWPPDGITSCTFYLRQGGAAPARSSLNNGELTVGAPEGAESADSFVYDPERPTPSLLVYPELGPRDHRAVERGVLTYTSVLLDRDLVVVGSVTAVLFAVSSAPDTDWVVRLCDVWPDGRSMSVCDGIQRSRYRASFERPEVHAPGQVYRYEIDLGATAQVFQAGHRLRLEVASSDFPRFDRNLNTGGAFGTEVRGQVAINTLFHDALRPSYLVLSVLP
jgi:putative CocE/NonD family hydrolase